MNAAAIYHEARTPLCCALDPETLQITLRTGQEVDRVTLIYADPYEAGIRRPAGTLPAVAGRPPAPLPPAALLL